ncbi:DNA/RNA helicase domain-containing protein [Petrotoga sp. 9T1HF07.CasAA.8.2]|uniref:DNA/RNA helicase domain-containing protein n=1 Tax=Petrotoga sp. 9T1HF07.CasAA.8.2 TaxID=1434329 RepID=UPI0011AFAB6B|nr:DNA/RNA helicase domain-containing protein [Petrotoga sp. 9T1HF07.CasAA.8.2]
MANFFPSFEGIREMKVPPTKGEWEFLNFLKAYPDKELEVFFQPNINGDNPDIVLMKKSHGVLIIEVKDWNLDNYYITPPNNTNDNKNSKNLRNTHWNLNSDLTPISSPFRQVENYKDTIFNMHIEGLAEEAIKNPKIYGVIKTAVFFSNENTRRIKEKFNKYITEQNGLIKSGYSYIITQDLLNRDYFSKVMKDSHLDSNSKSNYFNDVLYGKFKSILYPFFHYMENSKDEITFSDEQLPITASRPGSQKIQGVAGSGKTLIMAQRAINAYKRTKSPVLILTFNITLVNYIKEMLSNIPEKFKWNDFIITNYHEFLTSQLNNECFPIINKKIYKDVKFFEKNKNKFEKFQAIFIDEAQDFEYEWFKIIKNCFLAENGEYVVFADEKQNIYKRKMGQDKKPETNIPGSWKKLKNTHRINNGFIQIINSFQKEFLSKKYIYEQIGGYVDQQILFGSYYYNYYYLGGEKPNVEYTILNILLNELKLLNVKSKNVGILSSKVWILRRLEKIHIENEKSRTHTTFEDQETFEKIVKNLKEQFEDYRDPYFKKRLKIELDKVRKSKKYNFNFKNNSIKLSTTHSFKGLELDTIFLIIDSKDSEEVIYTGMTRALNNLVIIDLDRENKQIYKHFFESYKPELKGVSKTIN